ncbi:Guanine nucleotide exchange factor for Rab-3A, partial [Orchesella cincta]
KQKEKTNEVVIDRSRCDVDPILLAHFAAWRTEPVLCQEKSAFLQKMYTEEIEPCLTFANVPLVSRLKKAIEDNSIWVEPLPEKDRTNVPKDCALLGCPKICHYRMRFAFDSDEWFDISKFCRDRIAAVCEFLNYLRYIKNGLVKASVDDAYWEVLRLRKQMALAKLGIAIS